MSLFDRATPVRFDRKASEKPKMPDMFEGIAQQARERNLRRAANPGVQVEVEKPSATVYRLVSPHQDTGAWREILCDALATRSRATAECFLYQLAELCGQSWHATDGVNGEWVPDEIQLNMLLNLVTGIRPKNEMEVALAAQMVAVHLMMMKIAEKSLRSRDGHLASVAGKLARTFAMQTDTLAKLRGRKTSRQKITVSYETHEHRHVHVERGEHKNGTQPQAKDGDASLTPVLGEDPSRNVLPLPSREGKASLQDARRKRVGSPKRSD